MVVENTFVILAAGRGTRIGRVGATLHKCLVPLDGRAIISHQIDARPPGSKVVVCLGHRGSQVQEYIQLAHPTLNVTYVDVKGWDRPGGGPGASLIAARDAIQGDLVFTSCDTLWDRDDKIWSGPSWAAVAPLPAGTTPERWCRFSTAYGRIISVLDKKPGDGEHVYVGLARILSRDTPTFWSGINHMALIDGERQVSGGFARMIERGYFFSAQPVKWRDVGDEAAYRRAVAQTSGYDWTKFDEATYVLPNEERVVKYFASSDVAHRRRARALSLGDAVPVVTGTGRQMFAYRYVPGRSGYQRAAMDATPGNTMDHLLQWADKYLWGNVVVGERQKMDATHQFYIHKTKARIAQLPIGLQRACMDVLSRVDVMRLARGCRPGVIHGDFNLGNVVAKADGSFVGIDWREDFAGHIDWGDVRYDLAKLMAGTVVHWDRARRGDFRPWRDGPANAAIIRHHRLYDKSVEIIGALSLINCAPLHASPLDEILVARGCAWLEQVL